MVLLDVVVALAVGMGMAVVMAGWKISMGGDHPDMMIVITQIVIVTVVVLPGNLMMMIDVVIEAGAIVVTVVTLAILLRQIGTIEDEVVVIDLVPGHVIVMMVLEEEEIGMEVEVVEGLVVLGLHLLDTMVAGTRTRTPTPTVPIITMPKEVLLLPMLLLECTLISNHQQ